MYGPEVLAIHSFSGVTVCLNPSDSSESKVTVVQDAVASSKSRSGCECRLDF